jgi:hypothetical protein
VCVCVCRRGNHATYMAESQRGRERGRNGEEDMAARHNNENTRQKRKKEREAPQQTPERPANLPIDPCKRSTARTSPHSTRPDAKKQEPATRHSEEKVCEQLLQGHRLPFRHRRVTQTLPSPSCRRSPLHLFKEVKGSFFSCNWAA